jgi:hypothetical protein
MGGGFRGAETTVVIQQLLESKRLGNRREVYVESLEMYLSVMVR